MTPELVVAKLRVKVEEWLSEIYDESLRDDVRDNYVLAGGAIASTVLNEPVNDYDIWIPNHVVLAKLFSYYAKLDNLPHRLEWNPLYSEYRHYDDFLLGNTPKKSYTRSKYWIDRVDRENVRSISQMAMTLQNGFQIIYGRTGKSPEEIINDFDFEHVKTYITNSSHNLTYYTMEVILKKDLMYDYSNYPVAALLRVAKYTDKGRKVSPRTLLNIVQNILNLSEKQRQEQLAHVVISSEGEILEK